MCNRPPYNLRFLRHAAVKTFTIEIMCHAGAVQIATAPLKQVPLAVGITALTSPAYGGDRRFLPGRAPIAGRLPRPQHIDTADQRDWQWACRGCVRCTLEGPRRRAMYVKAAGRGSMYAKSRCFNEHRAHLDESNVHRALARSSPGRVCRLVMYGCVRKQGRILPLMWIDAFSVANFLRYFLLKCEALDPPSPVRIVLEGQSNRLA